MHLAVCKDFNIRRCMENFPEHTMRSLTVSSILVLLQAGGVKPVDCPDGFYSLNNRCYSCLEYCITCSSQFSCDECKPGYYGTYCRLVCSRCKDGACNKANGTCTTGCKNAYYLSNGYCYNCYKNCKTCTSQWNCDECKPGYYGTYCQSVCSRCKDGACNKANGKCTTGCKNAYYLSNGYCHNCKENCKTCTSQWSCGECNSGYYGTYCQSDCSRCKDEACSEENGTCTTGCKNAYYLSNGYCHNCYKNCKTCISQLSCDECYSGYYGTYCQTACSRCKDGACYKENGTCTTGCKPGYFGDSCETDCSPGCRLVNRTRPCFKTNGFCELGCNGGFWGNACDVSCGAGCSGSNCNRTTGQCLSQCNDTYFGQICDSQCSENCVIIPGRSCNATDGNCLNGCQTGWFGGRCSEQCGINCKERICDRKNGSCTSGCIDGYAGSTCSQALPLQGSEGSSAAAIGGGAGAGVAVLVILAIIVVAVILRKRKTPSKLETMNIHSVEEKPSFNQTESVGPEYSDIHEIPLSIASLNQAQDYQNSVLDTTISLHHDVRNLNESISAYQELDKNARGVTEYSTLDETTLDNVEAASKGN